PSTPRRSPRPSTSRRPKGEGRGTNTWGFTNSVRRPASCALPRPARSGPRSLPPRPAASTSSLPWNARNPIERGRSDRPPHRLGQALDVPAHLLGRQMPPLAMAGQNPLETVSRQPLHRLGLLGPRVPAVVLGGRKLLRVPVPVQVVTGEEEALPVEQHAMAPSMSRRRDGEQARR